ncbi:MAG: alpha/beta hydrolase [Pseudomonadota bacterium]
MVEDFSIRSGDYTLPARLYLPEGTPKRAYVLHPATGVPRDYYGKFAAWVAEQGFAILTYGYRSDGSTAQALRASTVTMKDWGVDDQNAALNTLTERFPDAEICAIGHSLGGFMTMFHDRAGDLSRLSAVCSGPAYWRRTPWPRRAGVIAFWFLMGPLLGRFTGYLPAKILGGTEDLPLTAFYQWRRWCGNRDLHMPDWGTSLPQPDTDAFKGRLNLVAASDDWIIAPPVVRDLARFYPSAEVSFTELSASKGPIGHMTVFRPRNAHHWPALL